MGGSDVLILCRTFTVLSITGIGVGCFLDDSVFCGADFVWDSLVDCTFGCVLVSVICAPDCLNVSINDCVCVCVDSLCASFCLDIADTTGVCVACSCVVDCPLGSVFVCSLVSVTNCVADPIIAWIVNCVDDKAGGGVVSCFAPCLIDCGIVFVVDRVCAWVVVGVLVGEANCTVCSAVDGSECVVFSSLCVGAVDCDRVCVIVCDRV